MDKNKVDRVTTEKRSLGGVEYWITAAFDFAGDVVGWAIGATERIAKERLEDAVKRNQRRGE